MAVLAMAQTAYQVNAMNPGLLLATSKSDIRRVLHKGQTALWLPLEWQRDQPDAQTNWEVTGDSIALDLARRLNAERMVLVKSCNVDPRIPLAQLSEEGIVDKRFASMADGASFPIEIIHKNDLNRMRAMLFGEVTVLGP